VDLYRLDDPGDLIAPSLISAFDGWVDSGSAATTALAGLASEGRIVARFEADRLFDYRARRPTLDILDGRLTEIVWPELLLRSARVGERDLLILTGAEPDYRWREFADAVVELVRQLGVVEWISLGAIPAAVPHTRSVPILGTASENGLLRGGIKPGPLGRLRVPSALVSVLELEVSRTGIPALGYFAQVPHYVSGPYPSAALELLRSLGRHLGLDLPEGDLPEESRQLRSHLDSLAAGDATTRAYVERLESMVDEVRLPSGDDLIEEIERFLRDGGTTPTS
jgi:hypothetical protein